MPAVVARISSVWRPDTPDVSPGVSTREPTRPITSGSPTRVSAPRRRHRPADGRARPRRQRIVVVFPEPFGPRKPNTPPAGTDRSSAVDRADSTDAPLPELLAKPLDFDDCGHGVDSS